VWRSPVTLPVDNPVAVAFGATPLDAEKSLSYSAGFVFTAIPRLNVTIDAYQIDIDDRLGVTRAPRRAQSDAGCPGSDLQHFHPLPGPPTAARPRTERGPGGGAAWWTPRGQRVGEPGGWGGRGSPHEKLSRMAMRSGSAPTATTLRIASSIADQAIA